MIGTPVKLAKERAVAHLREARECLTRAQATLNFAQFPSLAGEIKAVESGIESIAESMLAKPPCKHCGNTFFAHEGRKGYCLNRGVDARVTSYEASE